MTFNDALQKMLAGERLRRKGSLGYAYCILPTQSHIWKIFDNQDPAKVINFSPKIDDLVATDWEVIK